MQHFNKYKSIIKSGNCSFIFFLYLEPTHSSLPILYAEKENLLMRTKLTLLCCETELMTLFWLHFGTHCPIPLCPLPLPSQASTNHYSKLRSTCFNFHAWRKACCICVFVWLISFDVMLFGSIHFVANVRTSLLLWLCSIPLCIYIIFSSSINLPMDVKLVLYLGYYGLWCNKHWRVGVQVSFICCFDFFHLNTQKREGWLIEWIYF